MLRSLLPASSPPKWHPGTSGHRGGDRHEILEIHTPQTTCLMLNFYLPPYSDVSLDLAHRWQFSSIKLLPTQTELPLVICLHVGEWVFSATILVAVSSAVSIEREIVQISKHQNDNALLSVKWRQSLGGGRTKKARNLERFVQSAGSPADSQITDMLEISKFAAKQSHLTSLMSSNFSRFLWENNQF